MTRISNLVEGAVRVDSLGSVQNRPPSQWQFGNALWNLRNHVNMQVQRTERGRLLHRIAKLKLEVALVGSGRSRGLIRERIGITF